MYDWANSAFATTIMAAVLPNFYSQVICRNLKPAIASSYWAYTNTVGMLFIALSAPVLGAIADHYRWKKRFLSFFLFLGVIFTTLLFWVRSGQWWLASFFYIMAFLGFAGANIFYDSLLPHIASQEQIDDVSVLGYAVGYWGGGVLLAINLFMIQFPAFFHFSDAIVGARFSFVTVGIWWLFFSIPILRHVPEPGIPSLTKASFHPLKIGFQKTFAVMKQIRHYRELFKFLMAFWLYNDGIGTIIKMAVIYGTEIGIGRLDLIGSLLLVQFIGLPLSLLFGRLAHWLDTRKAILIGLGGYSLITLFGFFMTRAWQFWLLAILVGCVQGGTQALSRSLFGSMVPKKASAEFFGFYNVSQKFAGIFGPFIFGVMAMVTGSGRWGVFALLAFFLAGAFLLWQVDVDAGRRMAMENTEG